MTEWRVFRRECGAKRLVCRGLFDRACAARRARTNGFAGATGAILLAVLVLCGRPLLALEESTSSGTARHEFVPLTQISPEKAREFLGRLGVGTASRLPGTNALLVTAAPCELQKAIAILDIVDTRTEFDIKQLGPASARALLSNEQIADAVGGISIGTFTEPPKGKTKMRAILDEHDGFLVAIAPIFQLEDIRVAVESGPDVLRQRKALARSVSEGRITEMVQATAMADRVLDGPTGEVEKTQSVGARSSQGRFGLPKEMQQNVDEMRRRAAEWELRRLSSLQPDVRPASVSGVGDRQVSSSLSLGQSDGQTAEPPLPAGVKPVGGEPQENLRLDEPLEPVAEEPVSLQPGQVVPRDPAQTTPSAVEPRAVDANDDATVSDLIKGARPPASAYRPPDFANGDHRIDLMLPERLPIIQLVDLVGKYLGLTYIYNPDEIKGEVTLKINGDLRGSMSVRDLYLLLESVLKFNNLVMTRHKGNVVTIVPAVKALEADPTLVDPNAPSVDTGDIIITRVFELKHIDTDSADNLLQSMRLSVGTMPVADRNMLIVTAYAHRMERIERLLQLVDRPGEPRKFRFRPLRYTLAKTLTEKVKALAEQLESVTVTVGQPEVTTSTQKLPNESDAQYRTRLAQIRQAQAAQARLRAAAIGRQAEEPKPGVYLDADERTNRILMIGVEEQLVIVEDLVDALDVEQQDLRALQLYPMKHVDAEEVARKLQELGIISRLPETPYDSTRITGRTGAPRQVPGQPRTVPTPTPESPAATELTEEGLVGEPQVVVVESTNALLVNATPEQHAKITAIIEYVDSEMLLDEIPYKIYPLENSSPSHLAEVLESLIQETVEQEREGKIEKTVVSREEKIKIVPDPNTYSLIVYAKKKNQEWISALVEQLDKRRPQVLIDVTLVEVTKSDAFQYDLNVIRSWSDTSLKDRDPNAPGALLDKFVEWGGGTLTAFYGDDQIEALLTTMQSKNYGRVLAKPKLLVNDNEQGIIKTEDTTYVKVTSSIPVQSATAGPQSNFVETSVNYEPYKAGITLDITPHISEGDLLRLDVLLTRSDFLKSLATQPPNTRSNEVDTAVTLPNGSTVILGGLTKMNQTKGSSKVPLIGDIPIIGGLFRSINNEDTQSKLYVFVKAEVIRPAETAEHGMKDLEVISERNRMAFERHEMEFQRYQDWPGIDPKPVDPPKVLEAQ